MCEEGIKTGWHSVNYIKALVSNHSLEEMCITTEAFITHYGYFHACHM